ncbi:MULTISPECIES: hypothetical protein [Emticicia]|uniref:hypothetical protein n=1 Tax=Emticicia TaxID=312278 RepID=UPI000C765510|nr:MULTISPECIES: hypothetical protein [Emticicia]PLK45961.1 hypothetical protein C0V77_01005 [Emticicia sp. TH156]
MEIAYAVVICIIPLYLSIRCIYLARKSPRVSDFMKSIITAILMGIILVSISVTVHHFMTEGISEATNMSMGVLTTVQGIISGVVFMVTRLMSKA